MNIVPYYTLPEMLRMYKMDKQSANPNNVLRALSVARKQKNKKRKNRSNGGKKR